MEILPPSVSTLINEFAKLPTIGPKTASRLTFYLLGRNNQVNLALAKTIENISQKMDHCQNCSIISVDNLCPVCADPKRRNGQIIVVEQPLDTVAIEKTGYQGLYHILGGVISPVDGIGPNELNISKLFTRLSTGEEGVTEVIVATNPSLEGEATAMYIAREVEKKQSSQKLSKKIKITRLARGLPIGGDLEYADEETLTRAIEGRQAMD